MDRRIQFREGIGDVEYEKKTNVMMSEVEWVLNQIKDNTAPEADGVQI